LRLGNLLGDYVKGRVERFEHPGLTDRLRTGIQMHRTIDAFSDRHPAVHRSKRILSAEYGRLSGVIVDVFYDHVLARRWTEHHPRPLLAYTQEVYRTLNANLYRLPAAVHPLITSMSRGDWLGGYASQRGIERALQGMAQRRRWLQRSARPAACWPTISIDLLPTSTNSCPSCACAVRSSWPGGTLVKRGRLLDTVDCSCCC
jgi:acyl carrier protein phosphodiesterase